MNAYNLTEVVVLELHLILLIIFLFSLFLFSRVINVLPL